MIGRLFAFALFAVALSVPACALESGSNGSDGETTGTRAQPLGRSSMTRDKILDIAQSVVGYSYDWGGDKWDPDSKQYPGKCSGSCPSCSHWAYPSGGPEWGADCSGFVAQAWQVPNDRSLKVQSHPYSTYNFRYEKEHWYPINRSQLMAGDALVYHSGDHGHVALFDHFSPGGTVTAYECAGCMIGCIHKPRYFASYYVAIRRRDATGDPENKPPKGRLSTASCSAVTGWAQDPDDKKAAIDVVISFGGPINSPNATKITVKADKYRKDLCKKLGSCNHAFEAELPKSLTDNKKHSVYAYAVNSSGKGHKLLVGSPRSVKCGSLKAVLTNKWSSADRFRGKGADFVACTDQKFELGLTFKNKGTAIWRDVKGRGTSVGSDVFLVTANGKTDKLTGRKHYSLQENDNSYVRGDHSALNCVHKRGCRKTLFVDGGMKATAPSNTGVFVSRWRLRDYSKAWLKSKGFGPKVEVRVKVIKCDQPPGECGCHIWCSNGTNEKLVGYDIDDKAFCDSVGASKCAPGTLVSSSFKSCPQPGGTGGTTGGTGGGPSVGGGSGSGGEAGGGGEAGAAGSGGIDPEEPEENYWEGWEEEEGSGIDPDETPDDADFDDEGFDGDFESEGNEKYGAGTSGDDSGCSLATPRRDREIGWGALGGFVIAGLLLRRRRALRSR